jgi:hypothetical protein
MKYQLFDTVKIKQTGDIGFISSMWEEDDGTMKYAVNTGVDDNQPICVADDLDPA